MNAMSVDPPWSSQQIGWLQAMGYAVYVDQAYQPVAEPAPARADTAEPARAARAQPAQGESAAPPRRPAPRAPATQPDTAPVASSAPARRPRRGGMPDRLQLALLRASGCNPADPNTRALMDSWPLDTLRADPAAKRALWPQLRALRRGNSQ